MGEAVVQIGLSMSSQLMGTWSLIMNLHSYHIVGTFECHLTQKCLNIKRVGIGRRRKQMQQKSKDSVEQ